MMHVSRHVRTGIQYLSEPVSRVVLGTVLSNYKRLVKRSPNPPSVSACTTIALGVTNVTDLLCAESHPHARLLGLTRCRTSKQTLKGRAHFPETGPVALRVITMRRKLKGCGKCGGDLVLDGQDWRCWQYGRYYYPKRSPKERLQSRASPRQIQNMKDRLYSLRTGVFVPIGINQN